MPLDREIVFVLGNSLFLLHLISYMPTHRESVSCIAPLCVHCELWQYIRDDFQSTYCVMGIFVRRI